MLGLKTSILARLVFCAICFAACESVRAQLPPDESVKHLKAGDGITAELFAAEPMITNPSAIDVDTHGRVWVAELQFYRRNAQSAPSDKIKVLEDTDGDGRADQATVFAEGLFCPMSICVAGSKVFVATSPDLWVFEDADGDLKADGPPKRLLSGFGGYNHDHGAHSLVLGPDHKWWMSHGDGGFDVTGTDGSRIQYQWGAMLRGELDGTKLETVAANFRNPYEICVTSFGEAFCSDNDNDGNLSVRICWILEGGDYGWFKQPPPRPHRDTPLGKHWHFRGHIPGFVPATLVTGFGSPCGICFYEGNAFPQFHNAALHADAGPRELRVYKHSPHGAGMQATSKVFLTSDGDDYFRPDDICTAPDGSLFVADWYDGGVGGHAYNNPDQGRIYRLTPTGKKLARSEKPGPYATIDEALAGLASPNLATQFLAREKLLAEPEAAQAGLESLAHSPDANVKARALRVLDRIGGAARGPVLAQLASDDERLRALGTRILRRHGDEYASQILSLAGDQSWQVRREVLLAIGGLKSEQAWDALVSLAKQAPADDRYLAETIRIAAGSRAAELFDAMEIADAEALGQANLLLALDRKKGIEKLSAAMAEHPEKVDRKIVLLLGGLPDPEAASAVWQAANTTSINADARSVALAVVAHNLRGAWSDFPRDATFDERLAKLLNEPAIAMAALDLAAAADARSAGGSALGLATNDALPRELRAKAIGVSAALRAEQAADTLLKLADDERLREAAIEGLAQLNAWDALADKLSPQKSSISPLVLARLMRDAGGAVALVKRIEAGTLSQTARDESLRLAAGHPDANIRALFDPYLPPETKQQRLGGSLKPDDILNLTGDAERGRLVFERSTAAQCAKCHAIHSKGGTLGPELSQIGKKYERAALLETILLPSKAIAPEYVPHVLVSKEGDVLLGFLAEQNDRQVVIKDADSKLTRVRRRDIESLEPQPTSLMPELVLQDVSAQDAADLLAYLLSLR